MVNVALATARYLRAVGVQRVYGVAGEDHLELIHHFAEEGLRYVGAREESAACIMAGADAQSTGGLGVVVVTLAPGLTGAMNGIANAYLDRIPLLVFAGQHSPERLPVVVRQNLDSFSLVASITKWSTRASVLINQVLGKAIDNALASPSGPVFVELQGQVANSEAADDRLRWPSLLSGLKKTPAPTYAFETVEPLVSRLRAASRPILILGSRTRDSNCAGAAAELCSSSRMPAFTTPTAKGSISEHNPWLAGTFLNGNPEATLLSRSDLVIAVGVDAHDIFNTPWSFDCDVMSLEPDESTVQHFLPVASQITGDLAALIRTTSEHFESGSSVWEPDDVKAYRKRVTSLFASDSASLTIPGAIQKIGEVTDQATAVTVDAGFGKPLMSYLWRTNEPYSYYSSQGLSTMGYAIPAANALAVAGSPRPILGFMGDGSLHMRASEIGVAADEGVSPIFIAWIDGSLAQIEVKQLRRGLTTVGTSLNIRSCERIADAFGGTGYDISLESELEDALAESLRRKDSPSLIGIRTDNDLKRQWFEALRG